MSNEMERQPEDVAEAVDRYTAAAIPVHVEVDMKQTVLNLEEAEKILREADSTALGPWAAGRRCELRHPPRASRLVASRSAPHTSGTPCRMP